MSRSSIKVALVGLSGTQITDDKEDFGYVMIGKLILKDDCWKISMELSTFYQ